MMQLVNTHVTSSSSSQGDFGEGAGAARSLVLLRVLGELGPGQLGPGQLGPGLWGPGQLGPGAQLFGAQLSGAQLSGAQFA